MWRSSVWADGPPWWYRDHPTLAARLLSPVSRVWGVVAGRRYRQGGAARAGIAVICIGNLTAGGTGKTPLSLLVAAELDRMGAKPAFLTRGHGGRFAGPHWVAPGRDTASDVGDEPLLLARAAPTLVCRDRAAGARVIEAASAGHRAIVMDDGLQNGSLAKDLVIAVVDGRRGIGNGRVIPAGPLRAPLAFQLGLVDAFVVNEVDGAGVGDSPFVAGLRSSFAGPVMAAVTRPLGDTAWLSDRPILAFCGIGAPGRFFGLLRRLGAPLVGERVYADHHALSEREARALLAEARLAGALLVTTEKDWVRLADRGAPGELKQAARTLPIHLELGERDGLRLRGLIEGSLARLGAGGP